MNINYDIYDPQSPVDLMLAQLIVNKEIFATGKEYAAACRFCAVQLEVTQSGVEVQFPPVAKSEDIAVWLRELERHNLSTTTIRERAFNVELPACFSYLDVAEEMAYRLETEYQMAAVVKVNSTLTYPKDLRREKTNHCSASSDANGLLSPNF